MNPSNQQFALEPGGRIKGRYLIERELGRGGVGVVFLARDERLHGMQVVIKFLLDTSEQNQWLTGKFPQEAEALTRINHPGVVRVIDRDNSEDGRPFFVMEFIKGRPLREVMSQGPIDLTYAANIVRQIGSALHAAHQQGVFHRDLKPENVMLEQLSGGDEQVKLIDFGIAKVVNPLAGNETTVKVVAGSRQYIAPEQLLSQMASPATDVYTMGILVYEMVTGRLPFNPRGETAYMVMNELMRLQKTESFMKPRSFRVDLPEAAQILLLNALSFDSARRPQNARIFAEDLAQALLGRISVDDARATIAVQPVIHAAEAAPDTAIYTDVEPTPALETDVIAVARTSAPNIRPGKANPVKSMEDSFTKPDGRKFPIVASLITLLIIAATAIIVVRTYWPSAWERMTGVTTSPSPQTTSPSPVAPGTELTFNYSLTVRSDPEKYPDDPPYTIAGEVVFKVNDHVHFLITSPQPGYLYIINESPAATGQDSSFNTLFPTPTANNSSAQLAADKPLRIPEHDDGFVVDKEMGAEKLWLIWSAREVTELEPLKKWINKQDRGEIKDAAQVKTIREFLTVHTASKPQVTKDKTQTTVKMNGDILVKLIEMEHR